MTNPIIEKLTKSRVWNGTWNGRKGETFDYFQHGKGRTSRRINVHIWSDTGEVVVRVIQGDGRTTKFQEFYRKNFRNPTDAQIDECVATLAVRSNLVQQ